MRRRTVGDPLGGAHEGLLLFLFLLLLPPDEFLVVLLHGHHGALGHLALPLAITHKVLGHPLHLWERMRRERKTRERRKESDRREEEKGKERKEEMRTIKEVIPVSFDTRRLWRLGNAAVGEEAI